MTDELKIGRLLQVNYPNEYGIDANGVNIDMTTQRGMVELSDAKACYDCQELRPQRIACTKVNLRVNTSAIL